MFLPSLTRFLAEDVVVLVNMRPKAKAGELRVEPVSAPAVTLCPYYNNSLYYNI